MESRVQYSQDNAVDAFIICNIKLQLLAVVVRMHPNVGRKPKITAKRQAFRHSHELRMGIMGRPSKRNCIKSSLRSSRDHRDAWRCQQIIARIVLVLSSGRGVAAAAVAMVGPATATAVAVVPLQIWRSNCNVRAQLVISLESSANFLRKVNQVLRSAALQTPSSNKFHSLIRITFRCLHFHEHQNIARIEESTKRFQFQLVGCEHKRLRRFPPCLHGLDMVEVRQAAVVVRCRRPLCKLHLSLLSPRLVQHAEPSVSLRGISHRQCVMTSALQVR
mmetsp:Transcript_71161/g.179728  ORF Transcript_71161/g.179728 Transcript_71161/m.179728 type:complete len:276 (+) Transcript_71161:3607-4434(+)